VSLNNPKALNALDLDMIHSINGQLGTWNDLKSNTKLVYFRGEGGKAFCAGGDIMSLYKAKAEAKDGSKPKILDSFFRQEFLLDYHLATMKPVQVALWDGIVMGGGVGLTIHAPHRIATEKSVFAMPEAKIGFFTDVGGGFFLSKLKDNIGLYLGLTSDTLKGKDLVRAGIANHFIPSSNMVKFEADLLEKVNGPDAEDDLKKLLEEYGENVEGELSNQGNISR
jgi:3-hydroxyisobutyryl-CoA hydrolase